ncbi:MAG TPA: 5'-methylthioadenosine/S-adenosylhomocysteine nucleosidase [Polyangiaceae bacterium]|nr:5'-methylthioadenosine/S-adenosylhomocysteine nucleosidase [Polyangiaceae bacterium]
MAVLTVIAPELVAARAALGIVDTDRVQDDDGTVYFRGQIHSTLRQEPYGVVLGCIGAAGNSGAAVATQAILERFRPKAFFLVGIAAGLRDKVRIGDVVLSDRVVAYEPAALVRSAQGESGSQARPEIDRTPYAMNQAVVSYRADRERLQTLFQRIGGAFPEAPDDKKEEYRRHVASAIHVQVGTIASGEKLLRDPRVLLALRERTHGKIEVGEMEAAGVVEACRRANVPWLIVRGISDFGDELKDDRFHHFAAHAAATVLADFLAHGIDTGATASKGPRATPSPRRFFFGRPVDSDQHFIGRDDERSLILRAIGEGQPVQILGERLMGKSSLLRWAGRYTPPDRPVVSIDASQALSPSALVRAIAEALGDVSVAEQLRPEASASEAAGALMRLRPAVLLFDDADTLAQRGRGFDEDFFEVVRSRVEARQLTWVSASQRNLYDLFKDQGLTSKFLNSARKIWVGLLAPEAAEELASRSDGGHAEAMLSEAGRFAYGLQWLGDWLSNGSRRDIEEACDAFRNEMHSAVFARWWDSLNADERQGLKACGVGEGVALQGLEGRTRRRLRALCDKGLLREDGEQFRLEGAAWRSFVCDDV